MMMRPLILPAVFLLAAEPLRADVLPPGGKWISHQAKFENLADFPDYVFFVAHGPRAMQFGQQKEKGPFLIDAQRLQPDAATVGLGRNPIMGDLYLLAVPLQRANLPDNKIPSDWFDGKTPGVLQATIGTGYRAALITERRNELWTHFRVAIQNDTVTLTKTRDDKPGDGGGPENQGTPGGDSIRWYIAGGMALSALALLIGWIAYFRRK